MNTAKAFGKKPCSCGECQMSDDAKALVKLTDDVRRVVSAFEQSTGRAMRFAFVAHDPASDTVSGSIFADVDSLDPLNDAFQKTMRDHMFVTLSDLIKTL